MTVILPSLASERGHDFGRRLIIVSNWFFHPKFKYVSEAVISLLRQKEYHFRKVGTVVFLCGGRESVPRDRLAEYLDRQQENYLVFYAEAAWEVIVQQSDNTNALAMEEKLAELADIIVIVVESPGTFAELGAFAISRPLRKKLLPILKQHHRNNGSFVETGPVQWVDVDSTFGPSIWACHDRILEIAGELEKRLNLIPAENSRRVNNLFASKKHLLFFICDLVAVFGPCSVDHIDFLASEVFKEKVPEITLMLLMLGLGKAMNLLESFKFGNLNLFYRPLKNGKIKSFQNTGKYIDLFTLRARIVGAMQSFESGAKVLKTLKDVAKWN